ncbi:MAG: SDR family oxidoreductase [Verrucomicrobiota bacterium]
MKVLLLGCGFVGKVLATKLKVLGDDVTGWVRSEDSAQALKELGIRSIVGDFTDAIAWHNVTTDFDLAIHMASSGRGDQSVYEKVYFEGMRLVAEKLGRARLIFVSSTSVYAQVDGSMVDEASLAQPTSATSQVLLKAESIALQRGGIVVRPSGIYGPNRSILFQKFMEGMAVIEGDGKRWINQIHRDDVAGGIVHLVQRPELAGIFNLTDDRPTNYLEVYGWLSEKTGKPMPPPAPENHQRKRGWTHKRISNQKMKSLGWKLEYPTFKEGYGSFLF